MSRDGPMITSHSVQVFLNRTLLEGILSIPHAPRGLVIFAHGSGSSRWSPRNRAVAEALNGAGLATFLFDLLNPEEEKQVRNRFDIELLTHRLTNVTHWLRDREDVSYLPLGYFGASTGAAAALRAAALLGDRVSAVVSRGGRPDLARDLLHEVTCPVLLIVGARDYEVLDLNNEAYERLGPNCEITLIPGATHLFEEPGAMDEVVEQSREWFLKNLATDVQESDGGAGYLSRREP